MEATVVSASLSVDPVLRGKYDATVVIRSLKGTKDVLGIALISRKKSLAISALR